MGRGGEDGVGSRCAREGVEKASTGRAAGLLLAGGQLHGLRLDREKVAAS